MIGAAIRGWSASKNGAEVDPRPAVAIGGAFKGGHDLDIAASACHR
jgi:hypothetical protein